MTAAALYESKLTSLPLIQRGKVRDIYAVDDRHLLIVTMILGMILEGLPASVVLVPVIFPIATKMGIHPIHFNVVQTAAVGIGLFLPPLGIGLLVALRFAKVGVFQHARYSWPYVGALLVGLLIVILFPQISLVLPRSAGLIR